jgi:uncharacterized protein YcnI
MSLGLSVAVRGALVGTLVSLSSTAWAHVSLAGPGYANQSQVLTFSVGHGCEGADTVRVEVQIPKEVTSVRGAPTAFGDTKLVTDDAGTVTSVVWSKDKARPADDFFYTLQIRVKVPDAPFTTLYFPAKQTCRSADGTESVVDWAQLPGDAPAAGAEEAEPAPSLMVLPVRVAGWNKFSVKDAVSDLGYFKDAQIVWSGDAAYSSNPATAESIKSEPGVTTLTTIKANSEIWVKY